ncbi:MAG: family finger-like protein [Pseudomonas sp.]|nr:family finger-like protein [Pseudomonas sp.]
MTDSFVTQCPHCQTSFRVSHAQLSVARGVVRCGACLQVFNAAKQLLEQRAGKPSEDTLAPIAAPAPLPVPPVVQPVAQPVIPPVEHKAEPQKEWDTHALDFDSLDLDNLDLDEELAKLEQREIQLPKAYGGELSRNDSALSARRDSAEAESEHFDSLRNDDAGGFPELEAEPEPEADGLEYEALPEPVVNHGRTEPSLSFDHHEDDLDDEPVAAVPLSNERHDPPLIHQNVSHQDTSHTEHKERLSAIDDEQELEDLDEPQVLPDRRVKRRRHDEPILDLTDDPLQLDWQKPKPRWGRRFAWGLLILLAIAALAGQYVWYHFDELARQDQYRPWFQQLCPQIGCKVPSKVDINLLKSSNLVVRSHPEFKGALVVDAIIYNRASFSQPFPLLELRFADPNGQLIASRRFKPSEYLSGEMAGKAEMPPQTPIHIALDILDPGTKAVNYSLSFRSPE